MRRLLNSTVLTITLALGVAVAADAQQRRDTVRVRAGQRLPDDRVFTFSFGPEERMRIDMRRGRLGITVDLRPDAARDTVGARVSAVTPGGAADKAGVQTGDIVTRFNGSRLVDASSPRENDDDDRSRPGMQLINLASRLDAGDTVRLDLRRDSRNLTLTFVAEESDMDRVVERMRIPGGGMARVFGGPEMPGTGSGTIEMVRPRMRVMMGPLGDLEMVKVTPALAQGLGISEGLLVVDVGSDTALGLRAGDVIVSIGGRQPTSPSHAMRILSTYETGEAVSFDVMRQRRRTTVQGRLPEPRHGEWRVTPNSFEPSFPRMPSEMRQLFERELPRIQQRAPRIEEQEHHPAPGARVRIEAKV